METLITSFEELAREEGLVKGRQEGLVEGRQEGRQEGQLQERRGMVLRQLTHKLGALDEALRVRIAALDPETLLRLSDALLDFVTRADLDAWLAALPE
jgi:predicted transposase YdaD